MLVLSLSPWFKVAEVHVDHEKARLGIIWTPLNYSLLSVEYTYILTRKGKKGKNQLEQVKNNDLYTRNTLCTL